MYAFPAAGTTSETGTRAAARGGAGLPPQRARGYLLIEALAALLIATGTIGSLHALHVAIARDSRLAAERAFASAWAEQGLETTLTAIRAGDAPAATASASWPLTTSPSASPPAYWRRIDVTPSPGGLRADISVAWPHPDADPPRRILLSVIVRPGATHDSGRAHDGTPPAISP